MRLEAKGDDTQHVELSSASDQLDEVLSMRWTWFRKHLILLQCGLHAVSPGFSAAILIPATEALATQFNITLQTATYPLAVQVLFLGMGPFLWAPLLNSYGRRPVLIGSILLSSIAALGTGFTKTYGTHLTARLFQAIGSSSGFIVPGVIVVDLFRPEQRGGKNGLWTQMIAIGPPLGGLIGGAVVERVGWEWAMWLVAIANFSQVIACIFTCPETSVEHRQLNGLGAFHPREYLVLPKRLPGRLKPRSFLEPLLFIQSPPVTLAAVAYGITFGIISPADALRLQKELGQFVRMHPEVHALQINENEWSILQQVAKVLKPFWDHTNSVSKSCPTIVESLPIYWSLDDLLDEIQKAEGDFEDVDTEIRDAVERGIQKMNKFARKMDTNLLYYVASVLDPRIKSSLIGSQMSEQDAGLIISQVREFLKREYPHELSMSCIVDRPPGMSETMWRTLRKVQPSQRTLLSDIDRYLDAPPVSWSHHMIDDADEEWVLKWWKANVFSFPLMAKAARDYLPIPSAEVGIEREFSNARDVLGLRRHCLNAETMRWLMLLKGQYQK
ncbi:hypothetical protein N7536_000177 [Penicillium majusculum]|nr:hypothetical protein N7536_000177 [Penicillium majusculum]